MRASKKTSAILLTFLIALVLVFPIACSSNKDTQPKTTSEPAAKEPYTIGAIFDITGNNSSMGVPARDGAQMMVDEVNANGGINGHKINLKIYDNESDETKSVILAKKLISEDKVLGFVGTANSGSSIAVGPIAEQAKIPMVSIASNRLIVEPVDKHRYIYKTAANDSTVADRLGEYVVEKNYKKIAVMQMNNAMGDGATKEFNRVAKEKALTIVTTQKFEASDKDITTQLTQVGAANPDAIIVFATPPVASILAKNHRDIGLKAPLIYNHGIGNKVFIDLAGEAANGVVFAIGKVLVAEKLPDNDIQKPVLVKFVTEYEKKFGPRSTFAGSGYDTVALLLDAIKRSGDNPTPEKIRDELEKTTDFPATNAVYTYSPTDHTGIDKNDLAMVRIENGQWTLEK